MPLSLPPPEPSHMARARDYLPYLSVMLRKSRIFVGTIDEPNPGFQDPEETERILSYLSRYPAPHLQNFQAFELSGLPEEMFAGIVPATLKSVTLVGMTVSPRLCLFRATLEALELRDDSIFETYEQLFNILCHLPSLKRLVLVDVGPSQLDPPPQDSNTVGLPNISQLALGGTLEFTDFVLDRVLLPRKASIRVRLPLHEDPDNHASSIANHLHNHLDDYRTLRLRFASLTVRSPMDYTGAALPGCTFVASEPFLNIYPSTVYAHMLPLSLQCDCLWTPASSQPTTVACLLKRFVHGVSGVRKLRVEDAVLSSGTEWLGLLYTLSSVRELCVAGPTAPAMMGALQASRVLPRLEALVLIDVDFQACMLGGLPFSGGLSALLNQRADVGRPVKDLRLVGCKVSQRMVDILRLFPELRVVCH
ncbi:hypothetical protein BV25DRAFT_1322133 [Artomyces pyxidatus]|uniref:Uncharacterized protein n=1 Tax=Artomyces pyxidatus TaxID=48021 RepID=A0ACB8SNN2_9AGAM|nr:hypothetical protein BV25DRAFT_1322133 [Artomyces pyxidatus]